MENDSPALAEAPGSARRLSEALSAVEAVLAAREPGAGPDVVVDGLAEPIRNFNAAAKEAVR
ncbi:MAG: hypothetical protein JNJ63_09570 [Hyphomonadaceae bacterium]|nr:hypothetical protein [Hyphomonadaceae bacterium]